MRKWSNSRQRSAAHSVCLPLYSNLSLDMWSSFYAGNHRLTIKKRRRSTQKAAAREQRTQKARKSNAVPIAQTSVPTCWFLDPLRAEMRIRVRPPTQRTRRRVVELKDVDLPRDCFESFMAPMQDDDAHGFERDESGRL
eukprot:6213159-Pleurochrysis_carterae.AAC.1